jgi:hypothetical protein
VSLRGRGYEARGTADIMENPGGGFITGNLGAKWAESDDRKRDHLKSP